MGQSRKRIGADGKPRYTAYYTDLRGQRQSGGTFASRKLADKAWQKAEAEVGAGKLGDPRRGRQTFRRYVETEWLPNHRMELRTRENYECRLGLYVMPEFGPMKMIEILPSHVRDWIARLQRDKVGPSTIKYSKAILDAIFTTALNDQVTFLHPGKGVKTPPAVARPRTIITPKQFDTIYAAVPSEDLRLLVETDIESGARWGELTELRPRDLNTSTGVITISRVVQQLSRPVGPGESKFIVKEYPKDREPRSFRLSKQLVAKIKQHIETRGLERDDLLFRAPESAEPRRRVPAVLPDPTTLGLTEPNPAGNRYQHGTINGYSSGACRGRHCKDAYADYRARRRAAGKDKPRKPRALNTDGHIPRDWFRKQVWLPALETARLEFHVRVHDLRHAHASWLLAGGADLQVVKERLGHGSIKTTERYLHTLPEADDAALSALERTRNRAEKEAA
jgi:integrase